MSDTWTAILIGAAVPIVLCLPMLSWLVVDALRDLFAGPGDPATGQRMGEAYAAGFRMGLDDL